MSQEKPRVTVTHETETEIDAILEDKVALNQELAQADQAVLDRYWKRNLNLTITLLTIWFVVGYLLSIVFAPALNAFIFLGAPLGFWMAQNGAIYVFVLLIFIYAVAMNRMDKEFGVEE